MARGAKIQQHRPIVFGQHQNIVRCDVPVVALHGVQRLKGIKQRRHELVLQPKLIIAKQRLAAGFRRNPVRQQRAGIKRHDDVGSAVVFPELVDPDDRSMIKLRQQLRFIDETAQTELERVGITAAHRDREAGAAHGDRGRHEFLERHLAPQGVVIGQVNDSEAALAEHLDDLEFAQPRTHGQRITTPGRMSVRSGHGDFSLGKRFVHHGNRYR